MNMRNGSCGFTLIEIVAVIVIIGTLAAVTLARFAAQDPYDAVILRDQIVAMARAAQQRSLGHADVRLVLQPENGILQLRIEDAAGVLLNTGVPLRALALGGKVDAVESCAVSGGRAITDSAPFVLEYRLPGDLTRADGQSVLRQAQLCLGDDATLSVCVAATGFAHAGDCEP